MTRETVRSGDGALSICWWAE